MASNSTRIEGACRIVLHMYSLYVHKGVQHKPSLLKKRVQWDRVRKRASTKITCALLTRASKNQPF